MLSSSVLGAGEPLREVPCSASLGPRSRPLGAGTGLHHEQTFPSPFPPLSRLSLFLSPVPGLMVIRSSWTYLGIYHFIPHVERALLLTVRGERGSVPVSGVPGEGSRQEPDGWGQSFWPVSNEGWGSGSTEGPR